MYEKYLDAHREFLEYLEENGPRPERVRQPRVEAPTSPPLDDDFEPTPEWVRPFGVEAPEQEPNPLSELFRRSRHHQTMGLVSDWVEVVCI